jgi:hypothetical protein
MIDYIRNSRWQAEEAEEKRLEKRIEFGEMLLNALKAAGKTIKGWKARPHPRRSRILDNGRINSIYRNTFAAAADRTLPSTNRGGSQQPSDRLENCLNGNLRQIPFARYNDIPRGAHVEHPYDVK